MFGEHREKITQIILTAAEENVCIVPLSESSEETFSLFFSFLSVFLGDEDQLILESVERN